ncbi:hypothetical protein ABIB40_002544 [Pedobacter sp. UYP30]
MTSFMKPFKTAEVRYFDLQDNAKAMDWAKSYRKAH